MERLKELILRRSDNKIFIHQGRSRIYVTIAIKLGAIPLTLFSFVPDANLG